MRTEFLVEPQPSWNLITDLQQVFTHHFMQNAFLAGTFVAIAAGAVGWFMVLRSQSFAGHTLAEVGFAGASGAALVGLPAGIGLIVIGVVAALGISALGEAQRGALRSQAATIGTIQVFCLGLGLLFLRLSASSYGGAIYAVLFGTVLGVNDRDVRVIAITAMITLIGLAIIARPLFFASIEPATAQARGVPVRLLGALFLVLLAFAVAQAIQVIGVLLIFALLVTPGAIAQQLTARPGVSVALSVLLALLFTWLSLAVAYFSPYPVGFFLTTFAFGVYVLVRLARATARTRWGRVAIRRTERAA